VVCDCPADSFFRAVFACKTVPFGTFFVDTERKIGRIGKVNALLEIKNLND